MSEDIAVQPADTAAPTFSLRARVLDQLLRALVKRQLRKLSTDPASLIAMRGRIEHHVQRRNRRSRFPALIETTSMAGLPVESITPSAGTAQGVVLYLHGGAFFSCSPRTHRPITTLLAQGAGARVVAVDYRLAPEHPYPAALDDARAVYAALLASGTPASRIVVAGDSAGGNLALALLHSLREHGMALPAGAVLFSPWTDLCCTGASLRDNLGHDAMLPADRIAEAARLYAPDNDPHTPTISPLYGDFAGMPPLFLHVGSGEILLDDTRRIAEKARAAGVTVDLRIWHRLPHVFQIFAAQLPEARESMAQANAFIRRVTNPAPDPLIEAVSTQTPAAPAPG